MLWELCAGGELELIAGFIPPARAAGLFEDVRAAVNWQARSIRIAGRTVAEPRLTAWIGDPEAHYTYSGRHNQPEPWPDALRMLREQITATTGEPLNCVLCNLYRNGQDSMGMHADAEPELGPRPFIASLSLGATRRFQMRHRKLKEPRLDLELESGSLLLMRGTLQQHFRHGVPKQRAIEAPRINLTFRRILPADARGSALV
jgi:alkylated DNA repair dioxygenase AlkB